MHCVFALCVQKREDVCVEGERGLGIRCVFVCVVDVYLLILTRGKIHK